VVADIAVTGATGGLGGRVARRLAARGLAQRLVVRDPARAPDLDGAEVVAGAYHDGEAMRRAFDGARTVFLVSAAEAADRLDQHRTAVDAAVAAGVERVVYTSFVNAAADATFTLVRDHFHTEEHLRATGLGAVMLRDSIYTDFLPRMAGGGEICGPAGDGRFAPVTRDDIADAATVVLLDASHDGRILDLTGPDLVTMTEVAEILTDVTGTPVRFVDESVEEAYASRASYGAPDYEVTGWVTSYLGIKAGELEVLSDDVAVVTGHAATSIRAHLERAAMAGDI
jgi:NAD(P)H dehydrogenase (quinone)